MIFVNCDPATDVTVVAAAVGRDHHHQRLRLLVPRRDRHLQDRLRLRSQMTTRWMTTMMMMTTATMEDHDDHDDDS